MIHINILSYFTKGITDPIEKAKYIIEVEKYTIDKNYVNIYIYYDENLILMYNNYCIIHNTLLNIYKRPIYNENKCLRFFKKCGQNI